MTLRKKLEMNLGREGKLEREGVEVPFKDLLLVPFVKGRNGEGLQAESPAWTQTESI